MDREKLSSLVYEWRGEGLPLGVEVEDERGRDEAGPSAETDATAPAPREPPPAPVTHPRGLPPAPVTHPRGPPPAPATHPRGPPPAPATHPRGPPPAPATHPRGPPVTQPHPPLPRARWGRRPRPLLLTARQHEDLVTRAEPILRKLLVTDNYDSVTNFLSLHDAYQQRSETDIKLNELFEKYTPPIVPNRHTCVGLGLELIKRWRDLEEEFPGFSAAVALVSCEEKVVDVREYVGAGVGPAAVRNAEKEHVMARVAVAVDGRAGLLLADPGYHVPRLVTVMHDRAFPHTGWFTQSDEPHCRKEYNYSFSPLNGGYVEWRERATRGATVERQTSLVYTARAYLDGVNVTERRNLVYNFRSLLSRDQKGHLTAGLYFPVGGRGNEAQFTLFFDNGTEKRKTKYKFSNFLDADIISESAIEELEQCNSMMNYGEGELLSIVCRLAEVLANQPFIDQMLEINDEICRLCL